jgi:hypothetical protein
VPPTGRYSYQETNARLATDAARAAPPVRSAPSHSPELPQQRRSDLGVSTQRDYEFSAVLSQSRNIEAHLKLHTQDPIDIEDKLSPVEETDGKIAKSCND